MLLGDQAGKNILPDRWKTLRPVTTILKNLSALNPSPVNHIRRPCPLTTACAARPACYAQSEMSTAAQTLANQQNAQRSTGPQTPEGKAASSRNASTHGLSNASFTLLPTEDVAGFNAALDCYLERFDPQDHHEVFLTQLMVQSTWKLARIHRIQAALFNL